MRWYPSSMKDVSTKAQERRPSHKALTLAWPALLLVGLTVFALPSARPKVMIDLTVARTGRSSAVILGNSIIDHVSVCDTDRRNIAEMLSSSTGKRILDLSYGGQIFDESVAYAGAELSNPRNQVVILPISLPYIAAYDDVDLQQYLLNRLVTPSLHWEGLSDRVASGKFLEGRSDPLKEAFSFAGILYPDYNGMKTYFGRETQNNSCPEADGYNESFMRAYYYHSYIDYKMPPQNVELLASLAQQAASYHKRLYIVLMPMDYERMDALSSNMGQTALAHASTIVATLRSSGVDVINLSGLLHNEAFADRYCACGHLQESGRQQLTASITWAIQHEVAIAALSR
jgi:hypothetical protein